MLKLAYQNLTSYDRVYLARKPTRPNVREYIENLFDNFFEQRGDRHCRDDGAIIGGIATFNGTPVTVIGNLKGRNLEEKIKRNFAWRTGRIPESAAFDENRQRNLSARSLPLLTPQEPIPALRKKHGQGEAIARNLMEMCSLTVPIIAIVIGEGGSGGALALSVANRIWMLENAIYSILSPEGFATILWKDGSRAKEASELMKLDSC